MAKKHTIDIDIKNNADETAKDFNTLNKSMDNTTKSAKNLDATFEEVYGDLQPLTTRMGEAEDRLYELSLAGDTTSKEFQELLTKVGQYRKVQIQTDIAVDGAAKTMTEKLGSALTGATSGFALAQGSMALFGSENEALEKSLLKVQGALAIQQGVKGLSDSFKELQIGTKLASVAQAAYTAVVGTSTGALKLFRLALISTGIGAAVVAIGMLVANYEKVAAAVKEATGWFDKQHGAVKALMIVFMPLIGIIKGVMAAAEALGLVQDKNENAAQKAAEADKKRYEDKKKQIKELMALETRHSNSRIEKLELEKRKAGDNAEEILRIDKEINAEKIQNLKDQQDAFREGQKAELKRLEAHERKIWNEQGKNSKARLKQYKINSKRRQQIAEDDFQTITELEDKIRSVRQDSIDAWRKRLAEGTAANKEAHDRWKTYAAERLSIARHIQDMENSLLEDGIDKELEINKVKFERLIADVKGNSKEKAELKALLEKQELEAIQEIRQKYFDIEKAEAQELIDFVAEQNAAEVEANKAKNLKIIEDNIAAAEKQKELDKQAKADAKEIEDFKLDTASQTLSTLSSLAELFAGKSEKAAKRAFQVQKAISIAQATIDTYKSANAIFASVAKNPITIANPSAPFIAAGVAVAAGLVNVATIASQKFQGGGGGGGGGQESAPDLTGGAPSFNVVGDSGINQIAQIQQQPTQAFVVSGEVTTSQALDRNRVQNATL